LNNWQPVASPELIRLRAQSLKTIRRFFEQHNVLEVDTPVLSSATITDPFIESFQTHYIPLTRQIEHTRYYLHTSPEFAMKRLLAAGSGSIYQIAKVFRQGELSPRHNPEFTLLEWYREGWDHHQLMTEIDQLLTLLIAEHLPLAESRFISYQQAFEKHLHINPHTADINELMACARAQQLDNVLDKTDSKDRYLELLFSHCIEPFLGKPEQDKSEQTGKAQLCFLYHYPATQASLARITETNGVSVAERFEIFINGMELGNGFYELNNTQEQRERFVHDNEQRKHNGQQTVPLDEHFLAALETLPDCAGVAIGIERLLMVMSGSRHINNVLNFPFERA